MANNRRGRPRMDRPKIDLGTPEAVHKRMMISPDDATLSTSPLDAMFARKFIPEEAHKAAEHFRACRLAVFGSPHPVSVNLLQIHGMSQDEDRSEAEADYREACKRLRKKSPAHIAAIDNAIVHEVWPSFMWHPGRKRARQIMDECMEILRDWSRDIGRRKAAEAKRRQSEPRGELMRAAS